MLRSCVRLYSSNIQKVAVIGGGIMGSGIATVTASGNKQVVVVDINQKAIDSSRKSFEKAMGWVNKTPRAFLHNGLDLKSSLALVSFTTDRDAAVKDADLVIEAIPEKLEMKIDLFSDLEKKVKSDCLIASNTSSLSLASMSKHLSKDTQARFGGLHFFSPVERMALLEVISTPATAASTHKRFMEFAKECGKVAVTCKDTPGFAVNRLLIPMLLEATRMAERGDCSPKDIDAAMKNGAGHPMGPFELADAVGLDTLAHCVSGWHKDYPENPLFNPPKMLMDLVAAGKLGRKTGEGFYKY